MKRVILAFAIASALGGGAALAAAEVPWTAPGWYQIAVSMYGPVIYRGPFDSKETCEATLPKSDEEEGFSCQYLSEKPNWE